MTWHRIVLFLLVLVTVAAGAVAIWLGVTTTTSAPYPPLQLGNRTVAGPHSISTLHGDRAGGATLAAIVAVCAASAFVLRVRGGLRVRAASRR